jgi:hypothetical protein
VGPPQEGRPVSGQVACAGPPAPPPRWETQGFHAVRGKLWGHPYDTNLWVHSGRHDPARGRCASLASREASPM